MAERRAGTADLALLTGTADPGLLIGHSYSLGAKRERVVAAGCGEIRERRAVPGWAEP
ncbi:hypothetical protein HerbRD11066_05830 [Herbidospora sp. RD11066]